MTLHRSEGLAGGVNPAPRKTELFTSAISTICLACGLPDLGKRGMPLHKPGLHPSCTERIRADVSITAFIPITDLVDDPLQEWGGDAHIALMSCCRWAPVCLAVWCQQSLRAHCQLCTELLGSEVRSCQCLLFPGC